MLDIFLGNASLIVAFCPLEFFLLLLIHALFFCSLQLARFLMLRWLAKQSWVSYIFGGFASSNHVNLYALLYLLASLRFPSG